MSAPCRYYNGDSATIMFWLSQSQDTTDLI
jgi:hypothetical protein